MCLSQASVSEGNIAGWRGVGGGGGGGGGESGLRDYIAILHGSIAS